MVGGGGYGAEQKCVVGKPVNPTVSVDSSVWSV